MVRKGEVIYFELITTDLKVEDYIEERKVSSFQKEQQNHLVALVILSNIWQILNASRVPSSLGSFLPVSWKFCPTWGEGVGWRDRKIKEIPLQFFFNILNSISEHIQSSPEKLSDHLFHSLLPLALEWAWMERERERRDQDVEIFSRFEDEGWKILAFFFPIKPRADCFKKKEQHIAQLL